MHSFIFQVSAQPLTTLRYIGTDNIEAGEMASIDYAYDIHKSHHKEQVKRLAEEVLPRGMFTVNADGRSLTYKGGFDQWRKSYVELIKSKTQAINAGNVMQWIGPSYQLQKAIVNPLATDSLFVLDFGEGYAYAERSRELMTFVSNLPEGAQLYIGAVLGYHF